MKLILGTKVGMTQIWDDRGRLVPATVILATPNAITTQGERKVVVTAAPGKAAKAQQKLAALIKGRGIWVKNAANLDANSDTLTVEQFKVGELVKVSGVTKGKGFAGTIKRHNFHRGPVSHGSDNIRRPGSIGAQRPQRVPKGQKMPGHLGGVNYTARGLKVLAVKPSENVLVLKGAIPGPNRGQVVVREQ